MDTRLKVFIVMKAVQRINGKRGRASLIKVLRGSVSLSISKMVRDFDLADLWGILSSYTSEEIGQVIDKLCDKGFICVNHVRSGKFKYPMLTIGEEGEALLAELAKSEPNRLKEYKRKQQDLLLGLEMSEKGKILNDFLVLLFSFINQWVSSSNSSLLDNLLDQGMYRSEERKSIEKFIYSVTHERFKEQWKDNRVLDITMYDLIRSFRLYLASIPELEASIFRFHFNVDDSFTRSLDEILSYYGIPDVEICSLIKKIISRFGVKDINESYLFVKSVMSFINDKYDDSSFKESPLIKGTMDITYHLFKEGYTLKEIARMRGLTISTVYSHFVKLIPLHKIHINKVISPERVNTVLGALEDGEVADENSLKAIKDKLPSDYSYGEIKLVMELKDSFINP